MPDPEINPSAWHPARGRSTGFDDLPKGLLERARRRLASAALAAFGLLLTTQVLTVFWYVWLGSAVGRYLPEGDLVSTAVCILLWLACRARRIGDVTALRLGLAAEVLLCASLSVLSVINGREMYGFVPPLGFSTLVIAVFPLIIPARPRVTLRTSLLSAATAPLAVLIIELFAPLGHGPAAVIADAIAVATCPLLAVFIAYAGSRILHDAYVDVEELKQQQALLETLLEQVGTAVVLTDAEQRIAYANGTARELLLKPGVGRGASIEQALHDRAASVGRAWIEQRDAVLTLMVDGEPQILQTVRREIEVGFRPHELLVARRFTEALRTREIAAYKRIVRVLVHELNNSLAPIVSTLNSAQRVLGNPQHAARLQSVFLVVRERVKNLGEFLESYARLARLPAPRPACVGLRPFLAELRSLHPFELVGEPPDDEACFDPGQLQQVLVNLLKNAEEAGSPPGETEVWVHLEAKELCIGVSDRGSGLSDEAWRNAMTPLFSTKPRGSGLGLTLCREILEAHAGRIGLFPREGGGTIVRCWLPVRRLS